MGILTLRDNSKAIVNAVSPEEVARMFKEIEKIIDPCYLEGSFPKIGDRAGDQIIEANVAPKKASYFPHGQRNTKPEWVIMFK